MKIKLIAMLLIAGCAWGGDKVKPLWEISKAELYQPLRLDEVFVRPDGSFYVLNFKDAYIEIHDAKGKVIGKFGAKGKGPGEFVYPTKFFFQDNQVFVFDLSEASFTIFSADGKFKDRVKLPSQELSLGKVKTGWVFGSWDQAGPTTAAELGWANNNFSERKSLYKLAKKAYMGQDGSRIIQFNPINDKPIMLVDPAGERVYLVDSEEFEVKVFSATEKKQVGTLRRRQARIPFDTDWGNMQMAPLIKRMKRNGFEVKANFPSHFPVIRNMVWGPNNTLLFNLWRGNPDDHDYPMALNLKGEQVDMPYSWKAATRIVGVHGTNAYVTTFNDDRPGVALLPFNQVDAFVVQNPEVYDGPRGREIVLE